MYRYPIVAGAALLVITLLAACRSGSGRERPPTSRATATSLSPVGTQAPASTPSSQLPADVSVLLHSYALTASDMPQGYSTGLVIEEPNEAALSGYADPQAAAQEMTAAGRQGGLGEQIFPPDGVAASVGISIELFKDASGAQQWASQPPALPPEMNPTTADTTQTIGDAMSAIHWSQGGQSGYTLSFSRGRVVFGIGVAAPAGQESLDPAIALAQLLDQKAQQQSN